MAERGHPSRIDVVAQEDDELPDRPERVRLGRQLLQHRLVVVGRAAGVADEEDGDLDAVLRRHRGGNRLGRLQRGSARPGGGRGDDPERRLSGGTHSR